VANPGTGSSFGQAGYPAKLKKVYSKLAVFGLTDYQRIVYFDADTLVVSPRVSILFDCPGTVMCAALRHSERFNSGVMVITPSSSLSSDISSSLRVLPSYTGGDQGMLNEYWSNFAEAPLWSGDSTPPTQLARLPTGYNADVGLHVLNSNRWPIPEDQLAVLHFTLGPVKPWQWHSTWLMNIARTWQQARADAAIGVLGTPASAAWQAAVACALVLAAVIVCFTAMSSARACLFGRRSRTMSIIAAWMERITADASSLMIDQPGSGLRRGTSAVVLLSAFCSCAISAVAIVPPYARPDVGWAIFTAWSCAIFSTSFGFWLRICMCWGRNRDATWTAASAGSADKLHTHVQFPAPSAVWTATKQAAAGAMCAMALAPWLPTCMGITTMVPVVAVVAGTCSLFAIVAATEAPLLARAWFNAGLAHSMGMPSAVKDPPL